MNTNSTEPQLPGISATEEYLRNNGINYKLCRNNMDLLTYCPCCDRLEMKVHKEKGWSFCMNEGCGFFCSSTEELKDFVEMKKKGAAGKQSESLPGL